MAWWGEQTSAGPHSWQLLVVHQFGSYPGRPQNLLGCSARALIGETPPPEPGRSRWAEHTLLMRERLAAFTTVSTSTQQGSQGGACGNVNSSTPSPFPLHSLCPLLWSLGTLLTVTLRSGMALPRLTSVPSFSLQGGRVTWKGNPQS